MATPRHRAVEGYATSGHEINELRTVWAQHSALLREGAMLDTPDAFRPVSKSAVLHLFPSAGTDSMLADEAQAQNTYKITERLETGGMAEVFRGESTSVAGFKKQVAIKRVLPHLAANDKFIRMFLDEARLSARLSHANIVQVFDIGQVFDKQKTGKTYFIVMEYIDGINLKGIVEQLRKSHTLFPTALACHIAVKVCEGLFYAHNLTDSDGNPLNIVHRDISPPNVLISKNGEVKIVDFGLAKAAHSVEKTEPGVVKGKFSYLAPETALGHEADAQADIFAVGIMLWEMLAGRKLFQGETDYQTVKLVQEATVPSIRSLNPAVPEELEDVLRRALARDKSQRYRAADELGDDLSTFLVRHRLKATARELARVVTDVISARSAEKPPVAVSTAVSGSGGGIDMLIQEELMQFTSIGDPRSPSPNRVQGDFSDIAVADGAMPLDAGSFENLNEWAASLVNESDTVGSVLLGGISDAPPRPNSAPPGNLADTLEGDAGDDSAHDQPRLSAPISLVHPTVKAPSQTPASYQQFAPPPTVGSKRTPMAWVAIVAVLVLGVVGVGFFLKMH